MPVNRAGMGIFRLSSNSGFLMVPVVILEIQLNVGRTFLCVYVHYIRELPTPCAPAALSRFSLSLVGSEAFRLKMALCRARTCVSWRVANEIVASENRLVKFCNMILASRAEICSRKLVCFVRSSPRGPRSACMYETSPTEVTM